MAKPRRHTRWAASFWLPFLLLASATSPAWAEKPGLEERMTAAEEHGGVADIFRRLAAPVAAGPNVMAVDAMEAKRQMVRALQRDLESLKRRQAKKEQDEEKRRRRRDTAAPAAAPGPCEAIQTPPPSLLARQDNGQIAALSAQIQSLSIASSAVSQASRQVSQTSQQLAQQVTQLSQSTDRLSQSIQSLQQSAQSAQDAARQASQSASSAISAAQQSASALIASNMASITSSAALVIAAASASAINLASVASSQVQSAKADATLARADAATQVEQAQGTAVSVTQAALAVVGTFIGSVLLTILAFYLVLRYKNKKRRRTRLIAERGASYSRRPSGDQGTRIGEEDAYGYPRDVKERGSSDGVDNGLYMRGSRDPLEGRVGGSGLGFGAFGSGSGGGGSMRLASPPPGRKSNNIASPAAAAAGSSFSLFPKTPISAEANNGIGVALGTSNDASTGAGARQPNVTSSIYNTSTTAMTSTLAQASSTSNNPTKPPPSLQQWLRDGTVSPFGTLRRDSSSNNNSSSNSNMGTMRGGGESANWPFERQQQQMRTMMKRTMGVGGVNAGGGSGSMQPGGSLPLRE